MNSMAFLQIPMFMLILLPLAASPAASGLRLDLIHIDSTAAFTKTELVRRAVHRSHYQAMVLAADYDFPVVEPPVQYSKREYLTQLAIGTPAVAFPAVVDTGSDLIWTQCKPCTKCFPQSTPIYDPTKSSTYTSLPCTSPMCKGSSNYSWISTCSKPLCKYLYKYRDGAYSLGFLATETLTLHETQVRGITFGCGNVNIGKSFDSTGTAGLGRGPWSLVSQLGSGKFSYCLPPWGSNLTGPLVFGSTDIRSGSRVQTTPLVHNQHHYKASFYFVNLKGISIGKTSLPIPEHVFQLKKGGSGGMIVDSGTAITHLENVAYRQVARHIMSIVDLRAANGSALGLEHCFAKTPAQRPKMPNMIFHFEGADMILPGDKYMLFDSDTGLFCLAMAGSSGGSILGNYQQQDMQMSFDVAKGVLSFAPAECSKL